MVATNLVTDHSAVADGHWHYGAWAITAGDNLLTAPAAADDFTAGHVGKSIVVGNVGGDGVNLGPQGGTPLITTILTFISATQVRLAINAAFTVGAGGVPANIIVSWGTNNEAAFDDFNTDFAGQTGVVLTIPAGIYHMASGNYAGLFKGVKGLTVEAAGATIAGETFTIGAGGQYGAGSRHAKTATVLAGATSVTLLTPSEVSRFTVGQYALMTGISLQYGGYPTNHYYHDWVLVSAIDSDTGSPTYGKVTFATPLAHGYKSTWPEIIPWTADLHYGGPAMLYAWDNTTNGSFDHTLIVNNLTIAHHAQYKIHGKSITLNNCVFKGDYGPYPTMSHTTNMNNCSGTTCHMEVDKYVTNFNMTGGDWGGIGNQSGNENSVYDGVTVHFSIVGTGKNTIYRNGCSIGAAHPDAGITLGTDYGAVNSITISDSEVFGLDTTCQGTRIVGGGNSNTGVNNDFSMSGGVITIPDSFVSAGYVTKWLLPGHRLFWYDTGRGAIGQFRIIDITKVGSNILVTTDWPGTWPAGPYASGKLWMARHAAPIATFSNVTGCDQVVDLSANHVAGDPVNTRTKRQYTGSIVTSEYIPMEGLLQEINISVIEAYDGASGGPITASPGFPNLAVKVSDLTPINIEPTINLRTTGLRRWTAATGWTGGVTGDTLPAISEPVRITGSTRMTMVDISGESSGGWPTFTHEVIVDQGFRSRTFTCTFT